MNITPVRIATFNAAMASTASPSADELLAAAALYDARRDSFAQGKGITCRDIAAKLLTFGDYASEAQQGYAAKLVAWSKPRTVSTERPNLSKLLVPALFDVLQRHTTFHAGDLKLSRKNQDSLCWIMLNDLCVGKIENAAVTLFTKRLTGERGADWVITMLREFDADPLAAAVKYGKLSGRCCSCGRDLTDPASIEAGIGPVCATKFSA
jgi:hypothetical protein